MTTLQRRFVRVAAAAVAISALFSSGSARAAVVYDYVGNNFTSVTGPFTTSDQITGFVEFATAPTSGETDKSNVSAFSFTAGPLTLASTSSPLADFSFNFDSSLNIIAGNVAVLGLGGTTVSPRIIICHNASPVMVGIISCDSSFIVDEAATAPIESFGGILDAPGNWTVSPAPLPAALPLFISALAGLGFVGWRQRQAGG